MKKTIADVQNWQNQRVFVRMDFNVPLDDQGQITDDSRIKMGLPTLEYLTSHGARVILATHIGRPKGQHKDKLVVAPVATRLAELLPSVPVKVWDSAYPADMGPAADALKPGEILLMENIRFAPEEEANDPEFSKQLAAHADIYVNDAFGTAHRAHASTEGIAHHLPVRVAGFLMAKEIEALSSLLEHPDKPFTAIIGGSKISSKITVLRQLMSEVNNLVIGGGMVFTFLKAKGLEIGNSLIEPDYVETARQLLSEAEEKGIYMLLCRDVVVAEAFDANANAKTVPFDAIPEGWMGLDIGPESIDKIRQVIQNSKAILWNGPLGVFEFPKFAEGTRQVALAIAEWTEKGHCKSILGGGDTLAALDQFGLTFDQFTHVSSGGGASLEFLEGKTLPGIAVLDEATQPAKV